MMATDGRNPQPLSAFGPTPSQVGVQGEPRLALKDHSFMPTQAPKSGQGTLKLASFFAAGLTVTIAGPFQPAAQLMHPILGR